MRRNIVDYLGLLGPLVAYISIAASVVISPWFSWFNNALSDLGKYDHSSWSIFDFGLIVSGALIAIFAVQICRKSAGDWKILAWSAPLTAGSINLALIGVFTENWGTLHGALSITFFFLIDVTLLIFSYVSFPLRCPGLGALALIFGLAAAIIWFVHWPWTGVAIQEASTSMLTATWVAVLSFRQPWLKTAFSSFLKTPSLN